MWWPFQWLVIYVLGGLTFVPVVIISVIAYILTYGSTPIGDPDPDKKEKAALQEESEKDDTLSQARSRSSSIANNGKPLSGWLTIRRQFQPSNNTTSIFLPNTTTGTPVEAIAGEADENSERDDASTKSGTSTPALPSQPTTYSARIAQTYRQVMENRQKNQNPPKEYFYCVLKGSVLFLYEDEAQTECVAAIGVDKYRVAIEGKEGGTHTGKDAEMFAKRNAIVMRIEEDKKGLPVLAKGMEVGEEGNGDEKDLETAPWFIFSKSNIKMEDWYLALVQASAAKPNFADVFSRSDMQALVDTIDTEPDPIPMRWLNAFLGRMFFGAYRTQALEAFIIGKIMKKLSKVPRPSFLGPIVVREVNVGTFPPILSKPMLKDLTANGTASFEAHVNYHSRPSQPNSEVRITIATTATIPTGFKPYVVNLVLAVVLKSLEGNMVVQIKRPPSNRFWYGFTEMPKMQLEIQPIVSERKIQIGMILKAIEKQLREVIAESVVLPNMDDIAFFDTSALDIRGGIFSSAGKVVPDNTKDVSGGTEAPTQPGVDANAVAEDPSSAVAQTPGLRRRNPAKSQTLDTRPAFTSTTPSAPEQDAEENPSSGSGLDIVRTETAPPGISSGPTAKKAAVITSTKKWFANTPRPASITSIGAVAGKNSSQESLDNICSRSAERPSDNAAVSFIAEASNSAPDLVKDGKSDRVLNPSANWVPPIDYSKRSSIDSTSTSTTETITDRALPGASSPSGANSAASLITSLRSRDKKAIQTQATAARDAVKKWGVNWAAKRKTTMGNGLDTRDPDKPAALYRPPDEDDIGSDPAELSRSPDAPKSLQERLAAAAAAGQAASNRSGSVSSGSPSQSTGLSIARPALQATSPSGSPSMKSGLTVGSPPKWTPSSTGPTTEVARDTPVAAVVVRADSQRSQRSSHSQHDSGHQRRASHSHTVSTQPMGARSMVVPRVTRRPGEVVGIGSNHSGVTRRISGGEQGREKIEQRTAESSTAGTVPLPLASRMDAQGNGAANGTAASQDKPEEDRKAVTSTPLDTTGSAIDPTGSPSPAEDDALRRTESAPSGGGDSPPSLPSHSSDPSPDTQIFNSSLGKEDKVDIPVIEVNTPTKTIGFDIPSPAVTRTEPIREVGSELRDDVGEKSDSSPKRGDSGSSAEDALRGLVKRDEEVRAQKEAE